MKPQDLYAKLPTEARAALDGWVNKDHIVVVLRPHYTQVHVISFDPNADTGRAWSCITAFTIANDKWVVSADVQNKGVTDVFEALQRRMP